VDSLRGRVERATGMQFKSPPRSALRTREQVRAYLLRKLDEELPPSKLQGLEAAYRLFGLLPDTLELRPLLLELYTEQVAGYYDPDSATLFGVSGADPAQLRIVVAHEMVHALQGERIPLDSILHDKSNNDRLSAAHAVLEGQATLAGMKALFPPNVDPTREPDFWAEYADQVRGGQTSMPVLARAPLVVREALIFPYLAGAQFMHWWETSPWQDSVPYGPRMPVSTEQILFPERYARGDVPLRLEFPADSAVLYRVYRTPADPALVWVVVWDDAPSSQRFETGYGAKLRATSRPGYRAAVEHLELDGKPATRYVLAPAGWNGWANLPRVSLVK
jgi:hypothetical protein